VSDLTSRILELIARLGSREDLELSPPRPLNRTAMEAAYRHALRRWFELVAQGPTADPAEVDRIRQELLRLIDEVGEARAMTLRRQWARESWEETGVCPFCGERGPYHDPDRGGEPADA